MRLNVLSSLSLSLEEEEEEKRGEEGGGEGRAAFALDDLDST